MQNCDDSQFHGVRDRGRSSHRVTLCVALYLCVHVYVCGATRDDTRVRWAKAVAGGKCTKEGRMQAEVGTNAESFNEFE